MDSNTLSKEELLELRNLLYNQDADPATSKGQKLRGIYLVDTHDRRAPLPHTILSTAYLLSALLSLPSPASPYDTLFIYATALARFVTGFCDTPVPDSGEKRSMYDVAQAISMPEEWVEMRHEITHGRMPEVEEIEVFVEEGVKWLWKEYWVKLELNGRIEKIQPEVVRDWAKSLLRIRREKLRELSRNQEGIGGEEAEQIVVNLVEAASQDSKMVVDVFVGSRILFPKKEATKETLRAACLIWDAILIRICKDYAGFLEMLIQGLQRDLMAVGKVEPYYDPVKQANFAWIDRLLSSSKWASCRGLIKSWDSVLSELAEECTLWPGYWSNELGLVLVRIGDEKFVDDWKDLLHPAADNSKVVRRVKGDEMDIDKDNEPKQPVRLGGWKLYEGAWTPRPIGV